MGALERRLRRVDVFDDNDDINDWMARRNAFAATRAEAEGAGRQAWIDAITSGREISAARPSDVMALGSGASSAGSKPGENISVMEPEQPGVDAIQTSRPDGDLKQPPRFRFVSAKPGDSISRLVGSNDPRAIGRFLSLNNMDPGAATIRPGLSYVTPTAFDDASDEETDAGRRLLAADNTRIAMQRGERARRDVEATRFAALLNAGRNVWTGELVRSPAPQPSPKSSVRPAPVPRTWPDNSPTAKRAIGEAAETAGQGYGVLRAGWHTTEDAATIARLFNPLDPLLSAPGEAAWDRVIGGSRRILSGVARRVGNPNLLSSDLERLNVAMNPEATPMSNTMWGEAGRRFRIGANQGEALTLLAPIEAGPTVAKLIEAAAVAREAPAVERYVRAALPPEEAEYMLQPYEGMGAHYVPRRARLPGWMGGGPLPSWIMDSPLNVSKLEGANRWQQFRHHYKNDLKYRGGKVSGRSGKGSGWSGKRYGWERNGPLTRMIDGLPADAKGLVGGGAVATASLPLHVNYEDPTP